MLLLILAGGMGGRVFAQDDLSGVYYIANNNTNAYVRDAATNWYLVPASNGGDASINIQRWTWNDDENTPLVTTYQTQKDDNSVWVVKKNSGGDYFLIHVLSNTYMTLNAGVGTNGNRRTFHMETVSTTNDNHLFNFTSHTGSPIPYSITPKTKTTGHRYLNPSNGNKATYYASATTDGGYDVGGTIGMFNKDAAGDAGSKWFIEETLLPAPTTSFDDVSGTFTISYDKIPVGFDILYTIDGSDPTVGGSRTTAVTTTTEGSMTAPVTGTYTVKAVVARYGVVLTEEASIAVYYSGRPADPTITSDDCSNTVTMSAGGFAIYYTLDGSSPDNTSTLYEGPFILGENKTIKAVAYNGSYRSELIAVYAFEASTALPTISVAGAEVTITGVDGATFFYTLDNTEPTEINGIRYSGSFSVPDGNGTITVKAIAVKDGYKASCVAEETVTLYYWIDSVEKLNALSNHASDNCMVTADIDASSFSVTVSNFSGTLDGDLHVISGLREPLFNRVSDDGIVRNVVLEDVDVNSLGSAGAICKVASGNSRIYNCGILSGTVSGSENVGGLVGLLDGTSRVVNCYSYATVSGGTMMGG